MNKFERIPYKTNWHVDVHDLSNTAGQATSVSKYHIHSHPFFTSFSNVQCFYKVILSYIFYLSSKKYKIKNNNMDTDFILERMVDVYKY